MAQQSVTLTGHLVANPILKKVSKTGEIARFRLATSRRRQNTQTGEWESYDTLYIGVECWGQLARNVKMSLRGGMAVIATGFMVTSEWQDKDGLWQSRIILKSTHVGVDLSKYTVNSMATGPSLAVGDQRIDAPQQFNPDAPGAYDQDLTRDLQRGAKNTSNGVPNEPPGGEREIAAEPSEDGSSHDNVVEFAPAEKPVAVHA